MIFEDRKRLTEIALENEHKIKNSAMFLTLYSDGYGNEPLTLLQMGVAVMHDKPIYVIAYKDDKVPQNLRKIAKEIFWLETREPGELEGVVKKIFEVVNANN